MTQPSRRRPLVVDACVVLKWQLDDEEHVASAIALRDDFLITEEVDLNAPTLLTYELINGVYTAARRARIPLRLAREALANLLACDIRLHSPDPERVFELAWRYRISAYDASYVAVAQELGAELWTADRPLYDAVSRRFPWVRWIGDYAA